MISKKITVNAADDLLEWAKDYKIDEQAILDLLTRLAHAGGKSFRQSLEGIRAEFIERSEWDWSPKSLQKTIWETEKKLKK